MAIPSQSDPRAPSSPNDPRNTTPAGTPGSTSSTTSSAPPGSMGSSAIEDAMTHGASRSHAPGGNSQSTPGSGHYSGAGHHASSDSQHQAAQAVKERAGALWDDAKETARSRLNEQKDSAASGLDEVAGALRDAAKRQSGDGTGQPLAQLTSSAAEGLEHLSHSLRNKDVAVMLRDMDNFARNQPVAFFGIALAAGFLAVRFLKADHD